MTVSVTFENHKSDDIMLHIKMLVCILLHSLWPLGLLWSGLPDFLCLFTAPPAYHSPSQAFLYCLVVALTSDPLIAASLLIVRSQVRCQHLLLLTNVHISIHLTPLMLFICLVLWEQSIVLFSSVSQVQRRTLGYSRCSINTFWMNESREPCCLLTMIH